MCFLSWQDLIVVKHEPTDDLKHVAWTLGQGLLIQEKIGICWGPVESYIEILPSCNCRDYWKPRRCMFNKILFTKWLAFWLGNLIEALQALSTVKKFMQDSCDIMDEFKLMMDAELNVFYPVVVYLIPESVHLLQSHHPLQIQ
jgi:hypothetical protein